MTKGKDVYEHIAKVYLDPSRENKASSRPKPIVSNLIKFSLIFFGSFVIVFLLINIFAQRPISRSQAAYVLESGPIRINYNFINVEKETSIFDLQDVDLSGEETLSFRVRETNRQDGLHLAVEFISKFGEKSQVYIRQIPNKWKRVRINLSEFKNISHWSYAQQLRFVLEEWNVRNKEGIVYIDDIYFLK